MALNALKRWAEGKHGFLAFYAQWAAVTARDCFEVCHLAQNEQLYSLVRERVAPNIWLRFYRGRVNAVSKAWAAYSKENPCPSVVTKAYTAAEKAWTAKKGRFIVGAKSNREVEKRLWTEIEKWHYKELEGKNKGRRKNSFETADAAFAFTFRVAIPHEFIWKCSVTTVYREARLGNPESIGRLLRLDPVVLEDKRIRDHRREILRAGGEDARVLRTECDTDTSRLITPGSMKVLLAAHVVKLSKAFERDLKALARKTRGMKVGRIRFEEPEMRTLFDAVAQDLHGQDIDTDIPCSPEAFSKALQRAQRFWPKY